MRSARETHLEPLPPSWLGFKPDWNTGGLFVEICAYCPTKAEAELEARRLKCTPTHGICGPCAAKLIAEQTGERL